MASSFSHDLASELLPTNIYIILDGCLLMRLFCLLFDDPLQPYDVIGRLDFLQPLYNLYKQTSYIICNRYRGAYDLLFLVDFDRYVGVPLFLYFSFMICLLLRLILALLTLFYIIDHLQGILEYLDIVNLLIDILSFLFFNFYISCGLVSCSTEMVHFIVQ